MIRTKIKPEIKPEINSGIHHNQNKLSLSKQKINILLLEGIHPNTLDILEKSGYTNISSHSKALTTAQLTQEIKQAHIIGIRSRTQLTPEILSHAKKLMAIGCFCIGTNQVDLSAAAEYGIPVFNAPFANTRSVAELVIGHIIYLLRSIPAKNNNAHAGVWNKSAANSFEVRGKTLGIVGYGHIGSQLSILAENMGMRVIYYDIIPKLALGNASAVKSLAYLITQADVISLHVPETKLTQDLINHSQLKKFKKNSILINASRGQVVNLDALAGALSSKQLLGAAIDVYPQEPAQNGPGFASPLQKIDNVILTPHIGGSTQEAQARIGTEVAHKLVQYSDTGSTLGAVNFPQVTLPAQFNTSRILHIHKNEPGILSSINKLFDTLQINIRGQYLQTLNNIGYVVMNFDNTNQQDKDAALKLFNALKQIQGTIKTRILY